MVNRNKGLWFIRILHVAFPDRKEREHSGMGGISNGGALQMVDQPQATCHLSIYNLHIIQPKRSRSYEFLHTG